jgi:hypothetical protein
MSSASLAGTWGSEKKKAMGLTEKVESMTMSKYSFGDQHIAEYKEKQKHQFAKFAQMKESKTMILKYRDTNVHFAESSVAGDHPVEEAPSGGIGTSSNHGPPEAHMARTRKTLLASHDAPIAVGRSGHRVEKGVDAAGLIGERLCTLEEPTRNSFIQRSWLPYDDPALEYKLNGLPEATMPNDVSLAIGKEGADKPEIHWNHGRIMPGPMSKQFKDAGPVIFIE